MSVVRREAEEAANYYVSIFKDSKILHVDRFSDVGPDPEAPVVFIEFQINGQPFQASTAGRCSPSPRPFPSHRVR